ncbi:unnamed protein product [Tilletia caries]|nr:hypothetical protein CF336_g6549 [Tilletia laevis]KAE8190541.1 hypothetical protein CF335_g6331 [Tilletia laevis]CAD6888251.1 unnamed protein product [Tilletia caries]CAD7069308.1 unnamed protein product [Tilletia caries]
MSQHDPSAQPEAAAAAAAAAAASSPLAARRRPSDSLGGWSVEILAVTAAAPLPSSSRARSGTISYDTAAAAEHSIRPSLGLVSGLPRQYFPTSNSHSNLPSPLLPTSASQLPPASNASSPASATDPSPNQSYSGSQSRHYPPRAGEGSFMRKRYGSSSSIGLGLGILSSSSSITATGGGGNRGNAGASSPEVRSLAGTPRTSFSASFAGGGATVTEGMGGRGSLSGSDAPSPDCYQAGRHTSDVSVSSASNQAAGAGAGAGGGGGGGPGRRMRSRKTSLGSSGAPSRLAAAGGAAALFGSGNAGGGGMGSSVLGNTRQRTISLFASLSSPFRSAGESTGSKEVTSPSTSPMARHFPLAAKVGPSPSGTAPVPGSARVSLDRPSSRNRALSAVEPDRFSTLARTERSASGSRPPASGRATPSSAAGGVEAQDVVLSHHPRHQKVRQPAPVVKSRRPATAASAAADAIKTRDTEAMEDVRYFLLGENKTNDSTATSRQVLYHSKSEEKFGSMRSRRSRSSSDLSSQSNRARSQSRTRAGDVRGAPRKESVGGQSPAVGGKRRQIRPGLVTSDSTSSLPVPGGRTGAVAPSDTSELSDASSSLPLPSLGEVNPGARTGGPKNSQEETELNNAMAEIDAWADVEAPKLLAFLAKTMSRGEVIKFLSSASTLMYPFGSKRNAGATATAADANNGNGGGGGRHTPAPLEPALATAVRRTALKVHMRRFAFGSDPLDIALRKLLMEIKLPSETQQIDRVMEAFARRYMECNEGLYASEDQPYILAFSLMMLHTDAFNRNAKHKMTKADYVKNTAAGGVPTEILEYFYDNTTFTQFIHIDEETNTAVAALPTGGPPPTVSSLAGGVSQLASRSASSGSLVSRSASSGSLAGTGQAAAALLMSSANNSDVVLSLIGTGGNSATASFGSLIAGGGMSTPNLVRGPGGSMSSSGILVNGPGGKMKIDPYLLIKQGNLSDFRPSLDHLIPPETPYQYTGTDGRLDIGRLRRTFIHAPLLEIVQSRRPSGGPGYQPVWNSNEMMSGAPSVIDHYEAVATIKISKAGILLRKDDIPLAPPIGAAGGDPSKAAKKARGKKWKKWGLVLSGSQVLFFKDSVWTAALESQMEEQVGEWWADPDLFPRSVSDFDEDAQSLPSHLVAPVNSILRKRSVKIAPRVSYFKPDSVVPLSDAIAVRDESYAAEGDWVFRLWFRHPAPPGSTIGVRTEADGTVWESRHFLLQAATEQEMNDWISLINYSAAYRSVGDRKIDAQELAKLLCEASPASSAPSGPGPAQAEGAAGLNRASSTLRRHGSISGQIQVISSSTSNVFYSGSRNNSVTAEEPGGYMCSPQVTLQTFVTHAQAAYDDCAKQLEDELRVARHFAMLTPFLRTTRERIETAAIPVAEKVRERRLQVAKYAARLDVLRGDLEHVDDVAPSAMVFMPAPRSGTGPILGDSGMPRVSMSEGLRMEASGSSNELRRSDSASIKRVDSTPPQLDIDIMGGGGFDSRLDLFGSDRSGPRSSASHGSFALPGRRSEDPIELGDHPTGKHGMEASDIMEELTPTIGSNGEEYDLSGSASSSASALIPEYIAMQLEQHAAMQQQQQQGQQPLRSPLANSSAMYEQAEDWNKTAAGRRVSLALLPDSFESSSSPRKARTPTNGGGGTMALSANGPSNSGSGGGGPLSAINSALGAMKRKASISRP